jgi:hypothetical protein
MSALVPFAIAGFFAFLTLKFLCAGTSTTIYPPRTKPFTARTQYGELSVLVRYESIQEPFEAWAERAIGLWAIERQERATTKAFRLALEEELVRLFAGAKPKESNGMTTWYDEGLKKAAKKMTNEQRIQLVFEILMGEHVFEIDLPKMLKSL